MGSFSARERGFLYSVRVELTAGTLAAGYAENLLDSGPGGAMRKGANGVREACS
jgi:hypothetical protein